MMKQNFSELNILLNLNDGSQEYESNILKKLKNIFKLINENDTKNFRINHFRLSELLHKQGSITSFPFLCKIILDGISDVLRIETSSEDIFFEKESNDNELSDDDFLVFLNSLNKKSNKKSNKKFRILDFNINDPLQFSTNSILNKTNLLLEYFTSTPIKQINFSRDLATVAILLGISRDLNKRELKLHEFYLQFEIVLDRLNRDGYKQTARDYAEDAICCARADGHSEYGHYCRFELATKQYNLIDASIHGCLLIDSIRNLSSIPKDFQIKIIIAIFTFFRNFNLFVFAEDIYKFICSNIDLNSYDEQRIQMAYFNLLLLKNPEDALNLANEYSKKNINEIKKFGSFSTEPWFGFICNIKGLFPEKFEKSDGLILLEKYIESTLSVERINLFQDMILPKRKNTKNLLIDMMDKLHQTRNKNDHIYEVLSLQLTSKRLLENSLDTQDFEGIILSHRAMSDGSLAFELSDGLPSDLLIIHNNESLNKFKGKTAQYFNNTLNFLNSCKDYRHLWLGFSDENLYYIIHDEGNFSISNNTDQIKKEDIFKWLNEDLPKLAFDHSPIPKNFMETHYDIWSDQSFEIKKKLPKINLPPSNKHTIIFCDTDISCFPHNLLIEQTNSNFTQGICNPLSLDNYTSYKDTNINVKKISVWAPLVEEDSAITVAYSVLKDHMDSEKIIFSHNIIPEFSIKTDLKVFICHGGRAKNGGFTGLFPSNNKKYTSTSILGKSKVAILFICHGGHIQSDIYSRSFQTLTKNLLLEGYEAVIAPSWSLNIMIPGPWLKEFIYQLDNGVKIIDACFAANNKIKEIYPVESAWKAMHIFGNPNIKAI